ncbi:MAG: hypothetical protein FJX31_06665, partial [Alphaproteobacteria bacterium]|nr:hypothetical protein [Alphaproteobacteria bacterium]
MGLVGQWTVAFAPLALVVAVAPEGAMAQDSSAGHGEVMATVYGPPPSDLSGLVAGPEVKGIISARNNE